MTYRRTAIVLTIFGVIAIGGGVFIWIKLHRVTPQPPFPNAEAQFKYGWLEGDTSPVIPYWLWLVLPRIFPDLLPGPGGYTSLGISWELGEELPIGFSKKTIGYPRVGTNCAVCHVNTFRTVRQAQTSNREAYIRFLSDAANDKRFNADVIIAELDYVYRFSLADKLLYRYWIIPSTRRMLLKASAGQDWRHPKDSPDWKPLEAWLKDK